MSRHNIKQNTKDLSVCNIFWHLWCSNDLIYSYCHPNSNPLLGTKGGTKIKSCLDISSCLKKSKFKGKTKMDIKFVTYYEATKILFFANTKDKTPSLSQSSVLHKFICPGWSFNYIGKTEQTLHERMEEHTYPNKKSNKQNEIYEHLLTCPHYSYTLDLFSVINPDVTCSNLTLPTVEVILLFLTKQIIGMNCYLKKHY